LVDVGIEIFSSIGRIILNFEVYVGASTKLIKSQIHVPRRRVFHFLYASPDNPSSTARAREKILMHISRRSVMQLAAGIAFFVTSSSSWSAETGVLGNWKLVSYFTEELATGNRINVLGEHPMGYLIYTPQGRMVALLVHETRSPPKVDQDRIDLHKYMFAYSGRYTIDNEKVIHHVDISWNETWTGTDQVRFFKLEGNKLTITSAPAKNPITGLDAVGVLVWEREQ
jgi:hypothetical protein